MVNKIGGKNYKKKKKTNTRFIKKKKLIDNISSNEDYLIAKVTEKHNKDHFDVITMDKHPKKVYCSTQKSTVTPAEFHAYHENVIYVLIFKPQQKMNKSDCVKYESIILCVLSEEDIDVLISKYKFEFSNTFNESSENFIFFKKDDEIDSGKESEKDENNEIIFDIDNI